MQLKMKGFIASFLLSSSLLSGAAFAGEDEVVVTVNVDVKARVIPLKGTTNTRDVGGYEIQQGQFLRSGQLIRSENLARLTEADFKKLEALGVKTVIDLRTNRELKKAPTEWLGDNPPQFYHFPVGDSSGEWFNSQRKMMKNNKFTEKQAKKHMVAGYRMIAEVGEPSYKQLMEVVMNQDNWPIVFHCNAGKDRAGVATALIMEALGVDRETIMAEYLLTNEVGRSEEKAIFLAKDSRKSSGRRQSGRTPTAKAWFPIVGVAPEMLNAYYHSIDEHYGSMDAYLTALGVDQAARDSLAAALITDQPQLVMGE